MKVFWVIAAISVLVIIGYVWYNEASYAASQQLVRDQTALYEHQAANQHAFWQSRVELAGTVWHYEAPYATYKLCVFQKENEGPNWPNKLCARLDKQLDRATTQTSAQKKAWKTAK